MKKQNPTINPVRTLGTFCRRTYFLALLLALLLSGTRAWAQVYPVNVSMQGDALFYGSLATIGNGTAGGFSAGLFFNDDQEKNDRPIYYELSISNPASGAPLTVQSRGHYYQPGSVFLDANDIAKLVREKFSDQATIYNMTYREGLYTIGLRVVDEQTGRQISNQGTFLFTARSLTPPRLYFTDIKLACGRDIAATSATAGLTFDIKWYPVPPISSSTTIVYYVDYIMLPQQAAPSGALFQYNGPDEAEVPNGASSFSVDISGLQATTYIYFRVRAVVKGSDSNPIGDPDGISSEVCWLKFVPFSEAEQTRIVSLAVAGKVQPTSATLAWTTENPVDGMTYTLNYRPEGTTQSPVSIDKIGGNRCTISNLEKGTKYEFWVESQVQSSAGNPEIRSDMLMLETPATVEMGKCGIEPQTNSDLLKSPLAVLLPGDQVYMDGGFVLLVDEVDEVNSGDTGTFSGTGRVTMALSLLSGYLPNLSVDFDKIFVDTNYEFRGGTIRSKYEIENWYKLLDLNALTHGGELTAKLASGQLTPDKVIEGTIASADAIVVETTKNDKGEVTGVTSVSVTYTDGNGTSKTLKIEGNDLTPQETELNSLVIKDASSTYYAVDLETGAASLLGRYSEEASKLLAGLNIFQLGVADASKAVTFSRNQNVWAFDGAEDPYTKSAYYGENYNKVTYLGSSGTIYPTPWQFLPQGGAPQEVLATMPDGYDLKDMKFVTSTGLEIASKASSNPHQLILPLQPASGNELYRVYAFVMNADGTATYCGAMNVMTRSIKTYKAKLVNLVKQGRMYSLETLRTELNNIYNPCGIVWDLEEDLAFGTDPEYLDALTTILNEGVGPENNDAFFSEYTANQKALNSLYRLYSAGKSTYDDKTVYLFALPPKDGHLGDMPIGKQWGYLFGNVEAKVLAHELGHGKLSLAHTFDHNLTKGATIDNPNLMDYPVGNELVARQWQSMHDLAMIDPFQNDGDGAAVYFTYAENGELIGDPMGISSHTFFTPAGYPITFDQSMTLVITSNSFISSTINNVPVPNGALVAFKYDNAIYKAHYRGKDGGPWSFEGYKKYEIGSDKKLIETSVWYVDDFTANLPNTYRANIWQTDPKKVLQQVDCDWQIDCLQLFPEGTSNYMGAGTLVSAINPTPIQDLKDKYAPLFSSSPALTTAINNNPCALYGMRSIGEGLGFETQFMKGMNTFVTVGLAAALFPAVWEIMGVQALSSLSAKQAADISVNMAINTTFQTIIAYYFELPRDERTWKLALEQVDAGEVLLEIPKALIDKWYADLAIACAYSGFKEGDITSLDFDCKKCAEGVVEELAGMVFSGLIKSGSKYFIRLAKAARTTPDHFIDGLTEVADIDLTLDAANKVELINKLEVADVPNIQAYKKFLQVDWETLDKYTSNSWDMAEAKWGNASVLMNQDVPGIRYRKVSDALQVKHKDGKYLVYDTESNSLVRYIEKEGDEITDFSKEIFDNYNPDDDVARMFEVGYKEDLGTAPLSQIETHDVAKFDAYVDAGYTPKQQQLDAQYRAKMKDAPRAKEWGNRKIGGNPNQNIQVNKFCNYLDEIGASDIRVNQRQVDISGKYIGINRPDLQFTYDGKRYYVEWDTKTSNRGPVHEGRIKTNDTNLSGYNVSDIPSDLKNIDLGDGHFINIDSFVKLIELD